MSDRTSSDDMQVLGPEHEECVIAYGLLRGELVKRTAELGEARDEIVRLAGLLERWPTALTVDGTTGDGQ